MRAFAGLLDALSYAPQRTAKLRLMRDYFRATPDPDRGFGLAALADGLSFRWPVRRVLSELLAGRVDGELYRLSRDYVGDTAETVALIWPDVERDGSSEMRLAEVVALYRVARPTTRVELLAGLLDRLDGTERWAALKMLTGALRVGVSARLAKTALAEAYGVAIEDIEEAWYGLEPPYTPLFDWLEGRADKPDPGAVPVFRPVMLAHPIEDKDLAALDVAAHAVEWKWDGIRVQIAATGLDAKIFSRTGDDISAAFPDVLMHCGFDAVLDGELLVVRDGVVAPFSDLQQRLNRRTVSARMLRDYPAHIRLYDCLFVDGADVRGRTFDERRQQLERWYGSTPRPRLDVSELIAVADRTALEGLNRDSREAGLEGIMIKRRASPYIGGRPKGHWWKWKRAALVADCVLMYAQRGSGKRSSLHSDLTFGCWRADDGGVLTLVPVGKAYSGFTDTELRRLDKWVRDHTTERFGPVRAVEPALVIEVAFDAVQRSGRHKSGVAMRFPRVSRLRWDKPAREADALTFLIGLIDGTAQ